MNNPVFRVSGRTSKPLPLPQGGDVVVLRWRQVPRSVPLARRELRRTLEWWEWGAVEEAASLVLSELLTNAVRHGRVPGREIETRFVRSPGAPRIEVHDASEKLPLMSPPTDGATGGRGLPLVDALAAQWGTGERGGPGKLVWAELPVVGAPDRG